MTLPYFITAICTPLTEKEDLHVEGLQRHIDDQIENEIDGLLVGGTMGAMQLLKNTVYRDLVRHSVEFNAGRAELLVGVGDTSFVRTMERIEFVETFAVDGIVVITPFCIKFKQPELIHYFQSLADNCSKPIYLYDLPQMTGSKLEVETVLTLAEHPNIHGIKCSDHLANSRPLMDVAAASDFRVILAQPLLMDLLLRSGVHQHLDGIYGLVPHWMCQMKQAAMQGEWNRVEEIQRDLAAILKALIEFPAPLFASAAVLLQQRGISANCAPQPIRPLTAEQRKAFLAIPIIQKAIRQPSTAFVSA